MGNGPADRAEAKDQQRLPPDRPEAVGGPEALCLLCVVADEVAVEGEHAGDHRLGKEGRKHADAVGQHHPVEIEGQEVLIARAAAMHPPDRGKGRGLAMGRPAEGRGDDGENDVRPLLLEERGDVVIVIGHEDEADRGEAGLEPLPEIVGNGMHDHGRRNSLGRHVLNCGVGHRLSRKWQGRRRDNATNLIAPWNDFKSD